MMHKQFPVLEFTRVNVKGTCHEYSQASIRYNVKQPLELA